jgi:hypothetical protein
MNPSGVWTFFSLKFKALKAHRNTTRANGPGHRPSEYSKKPCKGATLSITLTDLFHNFNTYRIKYVDRY